MKEKSSDAKQTWFRPTGNLQTLTVPILRVEQADLGHSPCEITLFVPGLPDFTGFILIFEYDGQVRPQSCLTARRFQSQTGLTGG